MCTNWDILCHSRWLKHARRQKWPHRGLQENWRGIQLYFCGHREGHGQKEGQRSILHDINRGRYRAFFYSNSTSFMASIVVIVLLLPWNTHKLPLWPMHTAILLDMVGLLGAYAAGSTREWETSRHVIALVVPVLAYIAAYAAVLLFHKKRPCANAPAEIPPEAPQRWRKAQAWHDCLSGFQFYSTANDVCLFQDIHFLFTCTLYTTEISTNYCVFLYNQGK